MNDDRLIETLREEFQPEPMSPARAAAFRRELAGKLEKPRIARVTWPALASVAVASAALWLAWPAARPSVTPSDSSASSVELEAFVDPDQVATDLAQSDSYLPADYEGLALLLDEDTADR